MLPSRSRQSSGSAECDVEAGDARMMKQVAVIQCTKRSNTLKRTIVRPERPLLIMIMPRDR